MPATNPETQTAPERSIPPVPPSVAASYSNRPPPPSGPPPKPLPPRPLDYRAAFLSYLLPGLGQVVQGRVGKGVLFFVGLYSLFFYGLALGQMKNVWLPQSQNLPAVSPLGFPLGGLPKALYYRPQFLGQFWMGLAAWPALAQYAFGEPLPADGMKDTRSGIAIVGHYMMTPTETELNDLQRDSDKRWDLGWVYTLIAGALNLLVIYDAFAGPAIREEQESEPKPPGGPTQ